MTSNTTCTSRTFKTAVWIVVIARLLRKTGNLTYTHLSEHAARLIFQVGDLLVVDCNNHDYREEALLADGCKVMACWKCGDMHIMHLKVYGCTHPSAV